MEVRGEADVII